MTEPQYHVVSLSDHDQVNAEDLKRVFQSEWREVGTHHLAPGEQLGPRSLEDSEVMLYVSAGTGTAQLLDGPVPLRKDVAVTLFMGEQLDITAGDEPLDIFFAEIGAPA